MNFKIGDKVIINKEEDIHDLFSGFYNQELEVYEIGLNTTNEQKIKVKSKITGNTTGGHYSFFKLSPQKGDKVKILSHGIESPVETDYNKSNDYFGYQAIVLDVSYLDTYPYFVRVSEPVGFVDIFVKDVKILESKTNNIIDDISVSDYAKYSQFSNNEYVDEIMSCHYNNTDKLKGYYNDPDFMKELKELEEYEKYLDSKQSSGKTKVNPTINEEAEWYWENYGKPYNDENSINKVPDLLYKSQCLTDNVTVGNSTELIENWQFKKENALQIGNVSYNNAEKTFKWLEELEKEYPIKSENLDIVNKASHYNKGKYEVIDVIEDWGLDKDAYLFNCIKYIARSNHKGKELEDLRKAQYYLNRKVKNLENENKI